MQQQPITNIDSLRLTRLLIICAFIEATALPTLLTFGIDHFGRIDLYTEIIIAMDERFINDDLSKPVALGVRITASIVPSLPIISITDLIFTDPLLS